MARPEHLASYHLQQDHNKSHDFSSYDDCNIKDFDYILEKLKPEINEEEIDDNSTVGLFSDEEFHRNSSECFTPKFSLFLSDSWKKNLKALKEKEFIVPHFQSRQEYSYVTYRRNTYDIPALKLED